MSQTRDEWREVRFGPHLDDVMHVKAVRGGIVVRGIMGGLSVLPEVSNTVRILRVADLDGTPWPTEG